MARAYEASPGAAPVPYSVAADQMDVWRNPAPVTAQARVAQASGVAGPAVPR